VTANGDADGLPDGWATTKLEQITAKVGSGATPRGGSESYQSKGVPLIRSMNIHSDGFRNEGLVYLNDAQAAALAQVTVEPGDVLLNITGASIGRVTQAPQSMCGARVNQHVCIIRLLPDFNGAYLAKYLSSPAVQEMIMTAEYGVTRQALTKGQILAFTIPLPPMTEQKRIVMKVEELLGRVNAARERLAKVPALVKRFRQSVLAAACSGQLTADWRGLHPEIEPATALLKRIWANRATDRADEPPDDIGAAFPNSWASTTLGFLAEPTLRGKPFVTSGSRGWAEYVSPTGPYFIRSENINTEYLRLADTIRVNPPAGAEADRTVVQSRDLLLTITGNNVGRTAMVPEGCPRAHVSQHVAIIRLSPHCCAEFVWLWVRSIEHGQKQLQSFFYGYTKPGLNLEQVKSVAVVMPPIEEQYEIVRRVAVLFALADKIEARVQSATARVEKITQAILAKAFRGELVPTEAELARAECRSYEPASVLLERIRAEREAKQPLSGSGRPNHSAANPRSTTRTRRKVTRGKNT